VHEEGWWYDEGKESKAWLLSQDFIVIFKPRESVSLLALVRKCVRLAARVHPLHRLSKSLLRLPRKGRSNAAEERQV
jgi:hypothetical protein